MLGEEIRQFREKLKTDPENQEIRRRFHENYEWLESYWQRKFHGNNGDQIFCNKHGDYYWQKDEIKELAKRLAEIKPVGSSKNNFNPVENILRATFYLKYHTEIFDDGDIEKDEEEMKSGSLWNRNAFDAVFEVIKQIRNNLFHGRKIDLDSEQYERNKELVTIASDFTETLLNYLLEAESELG